MFSESRFLSCKSGTFEAKRKLKALNIVCPVDPYVPSLSADFLPLGSLPMLVLYNVQSFSLYKAGGIEERTSALSFRK